jgi:pentalenene synthase
MPQDVEFSIPIPTRVNSDRVGARHRSLAWARRHHLIRSDEAAQRYLFSGVSDLAAFAYPAVSGEELDLAFDVNTWFFLFDDQFDVPAGGHPDRAVAACQELIALLRRPPGTCTDVGGKAAAPIVAAFGDLWFRMTTGMSEVWRQRAGHDWVDYLTGNLTEATDKRVQTATGSEAYLQLRRKTIGWRPSIAVNESAGHFEVPPAAWHSSLLERMRILAMDHIIYVNEVYSLEKEEAYGDINLVHLLIRERCCSRREAIEHITETASICIKEFSRLECQLPHLCDQLELSASDRLSVQYYNDAIRGWIRGNYDWHTVAGRYTHEAVRHVAAEKTGYLNLEDLTTENRAFEQ